MIHVNTNTFMHSHLLTFLPETVHLYHKPALDTEETMTLGISPAPPFPKLCGPLTSSQLIQSTPREARIILYISLLERQISDAVPRWSSLASIVA